MCFIIIIIFFMSLVLSFILLTFCFFFFNDASTTDIYTLSLTRRSSDLLDKRRNNVKHCPKCQDGLREKKKSQTDRKSTRLNSSHLVISYAVFCLKKKKKKNIVLHK